jgi:hypothetical protein
LTSSPSAQQALRTNTGKVCFGGGVEVRPEQVRRNYRTAVQHLDLTENGNTPGTIGPAEKILNTYGDRGSGCTGLIIGKHRNLSSAFLHIRDLIAKSLVNRHCNYYCIAPHHAEGMFKREINRRWGLIAARAWVRLLIERIHILILGFGNVTELGAQARQRQFYYSRYVRNGHDNRHRPNGRG